MSEFYTIGLFTALKKGVVFCQSHLVNQLCLYIRVTELSDILRYLDRYAMVVSPESRDSVVDHILSYPVLPITCQRAHSYVVVIGDTQSSWMIGIQENLVAVLHPYGIGEGNEPNSVIGRLSGLDYPPNVFPPLFGW